MHERSALGPADVTDEELSSMVADLLGHPAHGTAVLDSRAEPVDYDLPAITTAGRYWVSGTARTPVGVAPYKLFVKHVQSWSRSPFFTHVPEEFRAQAEASVPWRTEPQFYRSKAAGHLPEGLTAPRALGVLDLDEKSAAVWLEEVCAQPVEWDLRRFTRAAYLLGRLAASSAVHPFADVGGHEWNVGHYLRGRLAMQVFPALRDPRVWAHPIVAPAFDAELQDALRAAMDRAGQLTDELLAMPLATGHGDACPNNLLVRDDDDFALIDFGFWGTLPIGFDLGQLLVGDVQIDRRSSSDLTERDEACVAAYVEGLRAEGCEVPAEVVRRAHALHLVLFTGLSTVPIEHLGEPPTPDLVRRSHERAAIARFCLDLLEATS